MLFEDDLFDYLTPSEGKTVEYTLHGVYIPRDADEPVALTLVFAGKGSPYWNALLKLKPLDDEQAATERAATLFAKLAVKGWKNAGGHAFTPELGAEVLVKLCRAKRSTKVDLAIQFACNPDNFTPPRVEAVEVGKP